MQAIYPLSKILVQSRDSPLIVLPVQLSPPPPFLIIDSLESILYEIPSFRNDNNSLDNFSRKETVIGVVKLLIEDHKRSKERESSERLDAVDARWKFNEGVTGGGRGKIEEQKGWKREKPWRDGSANWCGSIVKLIYSTKIELAN